MKFNVKYKRKPKTGGGIQNSSRKVDANSKIDARSKFYDWVKSSAYRNDEFEILDITEC